MSQRRYKAYLRTNYQKHAQQVKKLWPVPPSDSLPNGAFYPVQPQLTELMLDDEDTTHLLPGEKLVLSLPDVHYIWSDSAECSGTLQVTNYRLIFVADLTQPINSNPLSTEPTKPTSSKSTAADNVQVFRQIPFDIVVPLYSIEKVDHDPKLKSPYTTSNSPVMFIDLICKDVREYRFGLPRLAEGHKALALISSYAFDTIPHHLYTFSIPKTAFHGGDTRQTMDSGKSGFMESTEVTFPFTPTSSSITRPIPAHLDGWRFFNPVQEYKRMGIPNHNFRLSEINKDYSLCPTYPNSLVAPVIEALTDAEYRSASKFRSKNRVPTLTWKNPHGEQSIWRCAQPATGIGFNRSPEDEKLIEFIGKSNKHNQNVTIFDARPKANALANQAKGYGFESENNYLTSQIRFMNIENIHEVRKAYKRLRKACVGQKHDQTFGMEVQQSLWLKYTQDILRAVAQIVSVVDLEGQSCLCRCSDGWDRTAQMCSLAKLCLDPYYRTIRGFTTLIDHDWLSFGHKFHDRYGHFSKDIKDERSPIFLQFLDCCSQLLVQFPRHFEFTSEFLVQIAIHSFSSRFGTFLLNCEKERQLFRLKKDHPIQRISDVSISLWTYLFSCPNAVHGHFYNSFYSPSGQGDPMDSHRDFQDVVPASFFSTLQPHVNALSSFQPGASPYPPGLLPTTSGLNSPSHSSRPIAQSLSQPQNDSNALKLVRTEGIEGQLGTGSVLYPSYSAMKIGLWSDFFLRYQFDLSNEFFHYATPGTMGTVFPGGATTASFRPPTPVLNYHLHWSKLFASSLYLRSHPQQLQITNLQQVISTNDEKFQQLIQLLCEKDAMLQWYQNNHGPIPDADQQQILTQVHQNHIDTRSKLQQELHSPTTSHTTFNNNTNNSPPAVQGEVEYRTLTPQEENAFYVEQHQQQLMHRASYCTLEALSRYSTTIQPPFPNDSTQFVAKVVTNENLILDPLTGLLTPTNALTLQNYNTPINSNPNSMRRAAPIPQPPAPPPRPERQRPAPAINSNTPINTNPNASAFASPELIKVDSFVPPPPALNDESHRDIPPPPPETNIPPPPSISTDGRLSSSTDDTNDYDACEEFQLVKNQQGDFNDVDEEVEDHGEFDESELNENELNEMLSYERHRSITVSINNSSYIKSTDDSDDHKQYIDDEIESDFIPYVLPLQDVSDSGNDESSTPSSTINPSLKSPNTLVTQFPSTTIKPTTKQPTSPTSTFSALMGGSKDPYDSIAGRPAPGAVGGKHLFDDSDDEEGNAKQYEIEVNNVFGKSRNIFESRSNSRTPSSHNLNAQRINSDKAIQHIEKIDFQLQQQEQIGETSHCEEDGDVDEESDPGPIPADLVSHLQPEQPIEFDDFSIQYYAGGILPDGEYGEEDQE